jgi:hypothetical protein
MESFNISNIIKDDKENIGLGDRIKAMCIRVVYFFPVQLLILHLKKNHLLLVFWFLLVGYVSGLLASKYGVSYLFLYPEYLGQVNFWSYFTLGFALGGFITAFNIYSYVIHAHRFPFLATLSRPFYKFCINNFILPALFLIFYLQRAFRFKMDVEFESIWVIIGHLSGMLAGLLVFQSISLIYFYTTNKDAVGFAGAKEEKPKGRFGSIYDRLLMERNKQKERTWNNRPWRVDTYIKGLTSVKYARDVDHYDDETMLKVFSQNHFNASLFELLLVVTFLIVANYSGSGLFALPGGASVILVFTILLMILSMFLSWFRGWAVSLIILLALVANSYTDQQGLKVGTNKIYGLSYKGAPVPYDPEVSSRLEGHTIQRRDMANMEHILDLWKKNNLVYLKGEEKPKLVIIQCSGGGLRSALWTTTILNEVDSVLDGSLFNRTFLITGASGGILGAASLREQYINNGYQNIYKGRYALQEGISKDLLNPLLSSISSTDLFYSLNSFEYQGTKYPVDRAYRFEEQFLSNVGLDLGRSLGSYKQDEEEAKIPLLLISPTIINDGRRLLVSNIPMSFMSWGEGIDDHMLDHQQEYVEFSRLFKDKNAGNARLISLLRANATFPYILPQVSLPTDPEIQIMDAGIRDNFGYDLSYLFISSMRNWIEENTSGVVIVQVRDKRKDINEKAPGNSLIQRLSSPLGNVYGNFTKTQDFVDDALFSQLQRSMEIPVTSYRLQMEQPGSVNVSMSYHLTALEKDIIRQSLFSAENRKSIEAIKLELEH